MQPLATGSRGGYGIAEEVAGSPRPPARNPLPPPPRQGGGLMAELEEDSHSFRQQPQGGSSPQAPAAADPQYGIRAETGDLLPPPRYGQGPPNQRPPQPLQPAPGSGQQLDGGNGYNQQAMMPQYQNPAAFPEGRGAYSGGGGAGYGPPVGGGGSYSGGGGQGYGPPPGAGGGGYGLAADISQGQPPYSVNQPPSYQQQQQPPYQQQLQQPPYQQQLQQPGSFGLQADMGGNVQQSIALQSAQQYQNMQQPGGFGSNIEMGGGGGMINPNLAYQQQQLSNVMQQQPGNAMQQPGYAMQMQQQPSNVPAFFTLDQLPPNERFVKLLPHQANDIMEQLEMQV